MDNGAESPYVDTPCEYHPITLHPGKQSDEFRSFIDGSAAEGFERGAGPPFRDAEVGDLHPELGKGCHRDVLYRYQHSDSQ